MEFLIPSEEKTIMLKFIKTFLISIFTYYSSFKLTNNMEKCNTKALISLFEIIIINAIYVFINMYFGFFYGVCFLIISIGIIFDNRNNNGIGNSLLVVITSLSINYIIFGISVILSVVLDIILQIQNYNIEFVFILAVYLIVIYSLSKIKRFKNGFAFLRNNLKNEYFDLFVLNVSVILIFSFALITNYDVIFSKNLFAGIIISAILMFITIQKSLQLYYKQKQLIKTLEETQGELEKTQKDKKQLEQENIEISKRSHSLVHKQKSLEYKLNELIEKIEKSKQINHQENEEKEKSKIEKTIAEIKSKLEKISKEIYTEKATIELDKTEIENIDDMLKFQQAECIKNKIEFELQIKGNIHYMVNNLISKEDLEILIADHIKDAIIAIKHSENENRNILLRIGKIDESYGIYIYDSGIEFEKETLENLGEKPSTTHAKDGGTGMGFMNTFDTLRKSKASLIIKEIGKPSKDNFTKIIMIKFDNKEKYKVTSYRNIKIEKSITLEKENKEEIKI